MKIALIHCPFGHRNFSENLKVVDEEFCMAPPIVLAYVAAILERAGHQVMVIDANALKLSKEKVLKMLRAFAPQIIGFRADTYWFHRVVEWASYFKANLSVKVIVGGINVTLFPKETLAYPCFDYALAGEAGESLPAIILAINSRSQLKGISGAVYRDNGDIVFNQPQDQAVDLDHYPFPARHLLPNHLYYSFTSQRKNYTIMLTSTGCPYRCTFCAMSRMPFKERSAERVLAEIEECYFRHGVREIDFFDGVFFINKKRSIEICDQILKRGIKIEWSCRSRVDVVDAEILQKAAEAGCKKIYYGIESEASEVLEKINKNIGKKQIISAVNLTHKYGINSLGFFMVGNPGETRDTVISSIKFAKELKLDFIQVCRTIAKPNTELNDLLIKTHGNDYWRQYLLEKGAERRLPIPWTRLSEEDIEKYTKKFYNDFYFRLPYIIKRIFKSKSLFELKRYVRVAFRWWFCNYSDNRKSLP